MEEGNCELCGNEQGNLKHFLFECEKSRKMVEFVLEECEVFVRKDLSKVRKQPYHHPSVNQARN